MYLSSRHKTKEPTTSNHFEKLFSVFTKDDHPSRHETEIQLLALSPTEKCFLSRKDTCTSAHGCMVGSSPIGNYPSVRLQQMERLQCVHTMKTTEKSE